MVPQGAGAALGADLLPGKRLLGAQLRSVGGWEKLPCLSFWKQMSRPTAHKPILKTVHFAKWPPSGEKPVEGDSFSVGGFVCLMLESRHAGLSPWQGQLVRASKGGRFRLSSDSSPVCRQQL